MAATLGAMATGLVVVLIAAGTVRVAQINSRAHLQSLADDAASAGVVALGSSVGQTETDRRETAMIAAQEAIAGQGVQSEIAISIKTMTVAVALTAAQPMPLARYLGVTPGVVNVASSAEYVPPDQPSNWSWVSRQYLAGQRQGVVFRSTCSAAACGTQKMP